MDENQSAEIKLNQNKTELIVFTPKHRSSDSQIQSELWRSSSSVRNLGIYFDRLLTMDDQISSILKQCFFQLCNISKIRKLNTESACKTLESSIVTSRLDYWKSLLHGLSNSSLSRLQKIQNTAASVIMRTMRQDHNTPTLIYLHWLPVELQSKFNIVITVFKALHGMSPLYIWPCKYFLSQRDHCALRIPDV